MGIIDWLFSHVEYEEPEEIYHYEKIHFKTYLRTYCGILTINKPDNEYQLKVFIGEPYFKDGTKKYINEADLIDETDWQPLENAKQIIQDAHNIIKAYEVKERVLAYLLAVKVEAMTDNQKLTFSRRFREVASALTEKATGDKTRIKIKLDGIRKTLKEAHGQSKYDLQLKQLNAIKQQDPLTNYRLYKFAVKNVNPDRFNF